MSYKRTLLLAAAMLAACSRPTGPAGRTAILSFENLSGDPRLDWMGRGFAEVLASQLATSGSMYAMGPQRLRTPGVSSGRQATLAAGAQRTVEGFFWRQGGALRAEMVLREGARTLRSARAGGADLLSVAAELARALDPSARPYGARSQAAVEDAVNAMESGDAGRAAQAVARDPDYGEAWLLWARLALAREGSAAARSILEQACSRRIAPLERAEANLSLAVLRGESANREHTLVEVARLAPANPEPLRGLAEIAMRAHDYAKGARYLRAAAGVDAADPVLWNVLGYAETYSGNLEAAIAAFRRYESLRPRDANPLDSLADAHLYLNRPRDAARFYLEAWRRDPNFLQGGTLYKAAWALLVAGDPAAANRTFTKYLEARRDDPLAAYRRADWDWLTGARGRALEALSGFAAGAREELGAQAHAHLAIWKLESGDAAGARREAETAARLAPRSGLARAALFMTGGGELPPGPLRDYAEAGALLLARRFDGAIPLLRRAYQGGELGSSDPGIPVLLAWAYLESGRWQDAGPLLAPNPIPQPGGLNPFTPLWFPRVFALRARVLEKEGKRGEAAENFRLFQALSGSAVTASPGSR
ncbi:MAG: hypothetical protein ACE15B_06425 [Bryobacteraceae bacterium]